MLPRGNTDGATEKVGKMLRTIFLLQLNQLILCHALASVKLNSVGTEKHANDMALQSRIADMLSNEELVYANVETTHCSCIDGRDSSQVIGAPGGDAGEFVLNMAVYEKHIISRENRTLLESEVLSLLNLFLSDNVPLTRGFYMHTDHDSLLEMTHHLNSLHHFP